MKRRLCSALAAVLLLIGVMTGCSNVTYVAKVNGTEVPLRYYTVNMLITKIQFESAYGDNYQDYMTQPNSSDPEKTNAEVLNEAARKTFERLYTNLLKVTEMGLAVNEVQLEFYKAEYEYFRSIFASNADFDLFLREAGVSEEELQEVYLINTVYPDLIKNHFYDKDVGIEAYTDQDVRDYFDENTQYVIKHILFQVATEDADGNPLSESEIAANDAAAKQEAEETLAKIRAGELDFDSAMNELTDDSSVAMYPDGYGFTEEDDFVNEAFKQAGAELQPGEMGIYRSEEFGYHIIQAIDKDEFFNAQSDVYEEAMVSELLEEKYARWAEDIQFEYNDAALKKYDFASMGRSRIKLNPNALGS